jgi:SAM-dependent methyltransferase
MSDWPNEGPPMKYNVRYRTTCRVCGAAEPRRFLRFEDMPFTDGFVSAATAGSEFLAPLDVYWCPACRTAQTLHDVEVSEYYREYRYTVSTSSLARTFMRRLAEETFRRFGFGPGDSVIEIGSGDGHQLKCFQDVGAQVLGFEPSDDLTRASRAAGVPVAQCLFHSGTVGEIPADMRPARVVLLTYTFDHLPDPLAFLRAVREALDPVHGVLLIEVHDLQKIVSRRETCLFEHEHSIYLTTLSMRRLLARAGFDLLTADLLPESERRGNSLLVAAGVSGCRHAADPVVAADAAAAPLEEWETYAAFGSAVDRGLRRMRDHVRELRGEGRRVAGYGAGGRGVMTVAQAGLGADDLAYLCDQNASFHGLMAPKSHVPVVSPDRVTADPVDELIVFSFGYMDEIRRQYADFQSRGGRLVSMLDLL